MEYALLIIIVIGALIATGNYIKRGIQGRWKESVDGLGDQYDPRFGNGSVQYTLLSNTETRIMAVCAVGGFWTDRRDFGNTLELRNGSMAVFAY